MTTSTSVERRRLRTRRALLSVTTILAAGFALPAQAQFAAPAPVRQSVDANGVDLFLGTLNVDGPSLTIGSGDQGLSYHKINQAGIWNDNVVALLNLTGNTMTVSLGDTSDSFSVSGSNYTATEGNGATLTFNSSTNVFTYTRSDGTIIQFDKNRSSDVPFYSNAGRVTVITQPNGTRLTFSYDSIQYCSRTKSLNNRDVCTQRSVAYRVNNLQSSYGYALTFSYGSINSYDPNDPGDQPDLVTWSTVLGASAVNLAGSPGNTLSQSFSGSSSGAVITDALGRSTSYRLSGSTIVGITHPGQNSEDETISYSNGRVSSITTPVGTTRYSSYDLQGFRNVQVTPPGMSPFYYSFDLTSTRMVSTIDQLSHSTSWSYDDNGRITQVNAFEGNSTHYAYDGRGNVTEVRKVAKPNTGLADIVSSAVFPASCSNALTCNKPTSTTDANGNVTTYAYDPGHGDVTSVTGPAINGIQPQTRYSYAPLQAYFRNASGSIVASGVTSYRLTGTSACQANASCAGTADEVVTSIGYGPQSSGIGNNLLPVSTSTGAGDGSLTATTAVSYDDIGNVIAVDGPLPGGSDTTNYSYDADRELTAVVSPDPDGSGPLNRREIAYHYILNGVNDSQVVGTIDANGNFQALQTLVYGIDGAGRQTQALVSAGGTTYGVTQYSYDGTGRLACTAVRMNAAAFGSLPDACTLGPVGSFGNDRLTRTQYDAVGRPSIVTSGYGTPDASNDVSTSYTPNGQVANVTDALGNMTADIFDGFDRVIARQYPAAQQGSNASNGNDHEEFGYDPNGNIVAARKRDGRLIQYAVDPLNRVTSKGIAGGCAPIQVGACTPASATRSVYYGYDLLGRLGYARFDNPNGEGISATYDALGRMTSSTSTMGGNARTLSYRYDLQGNRTGLVYPDGTSIAYGYDVLGELSNASWSGPGGGTTPFLSPGYDDLGRRTVVHRASSSTLYGFDGASRLTSQSQQFNGGVGNASTGFGYNPAAQIVTQTRDNDQFASTAGKNSSQAYTVNGLNQYVAAGAASLTYDANGNLIGDGANSYIYDAENRLVSASGAHTATLTYDPLGRLFQTSGGSAGTTQFLYDGDQLVSEYDGANGLLRRYVFGSQGDEPVMWDEGTAMNCSGAKFLHADEGGSVVALADCGGNRTAVNAYDEYGVPNATNQGRFQYTGQAWIPELGLYYYKARMYDPTMGRFLQTDPIGYADGLNWYNYVGGDPVNLVDPSGSDETNDNDIVVTGRRNPPPPPTPPSIIIRAPAIAPNAANQAAQPGDVVVTARRKPQRVANKIDCNTKLPDGTTVGGRIAALSNTINGSVSTTSTPYGSSASYSSGYSPLSIPGQVYRQTNFKIMFKGQGDAAFLGDAGNFAYGAVSANIGVPLSATEAVAGGYAWWAGHPDRNGPWGMDASATAQVPAGYGASCARH